MKLLSFQFKVLIMTNFMLLASMLYSGSAYSQVSCSSNLLSNPGFESSLTGWSTQGNVTISTAANSGTKAAKVSDSGYGSVGFILPATAGTAYTAKVWAKQTGTAYKVVELRFLNSSYMALSGGASQDIPSATYTERTMSGTAPAGTVYVYVIGSKDGNGTLEVDDWCLTSGAPTPTLNITCPIGNGTVVAQPGQNGAFFSFGNATATSTCTTGSVTVTQTSGLPSGSIYPIGNTEVCFTAIDGCSNTKVCCFTVTVTSQPPACNIAGTTVASTCNNNGTPTNPADDYFTVATTVTGATNWTGLLMPVQPAGGVSITSATTTFTIAEIQPYIVNGQVQVLLQNNAIAGCSATVYFTPPASCSTSTPPDQGCFFEKNYTVISATTQSFSMKAKENTDGSFSATVFTSPSGTNTKVTRVDADAAGNYITHALLGSNLPNNVNYVDDGYMSDSYVQSNNSNQLTVTRFNFAGTQVWQKSYTITGASSIAAPVAKASVAGGFLYTGVVTKTGQPLNQFYPFAIKVDLQGNVVWQNIWTAAIASPGAVFLKAEAVSGGYFLEVFQPSNISTKLAKINANGVFQWEFTLTGGSSINLNDVSESPDGQSVYAAFAIVGSSNYSVKFVRLNANGSFVWEKDNPGITSAADQRKVSPSVLATNDGAVVAFRSFFLTGAAQNRFNYSKLALNGDVLWSKFKADVTAEVYAKTSDGGLLFGGTGLTNNGVPYLLKTSANGNEMPACQGNGGQIDLSLALQQLTTSATQWSSYTVKATISNAGPQAATGVKVKWQKPTGVVYVGSNSHTASQGTFSPYGDEVWTVGSIPANGSATLTVNYFLLNPTASPAYAQVVAHSETDVDSQPNNGTPPTPVQDDEASASTIGVNVPDLQCSNLQVPTSGALGTNFNFSVLVKNIGIVASPVAGLKVTLASFPLEIIVVPILQPGEELTISLILSVPTGFLVGNYPLTATVNPDGVFVEASTLNNAVSSAFQVTEAGGGQPDLTVLTANAPGITNIQAGNGFSLDYAIKNIGTGNAGLFETTYIISNDNVPSADDAYIGGAGFGLGLTAGSTESRISNVAVPTNIQPGNYFLIVAVNIQNQIPESSYSNNQVTLPMTVVSPGGGTLNCNSITITPGPGTLSIANATAPHVLIKVFRPNWTIAFQCIDAACSQPVNLTGLGAGIHNVQILLFNANWQTICSRNEAVTVANLNNSGGINSESNPGVTLLSNKLQLETLYPNPAEQEVILQMVAAEDDIIHLQLYDARGALKGNFEIALQAGVNNISLDIADLPTGMYHVLFQTGQRHAPVRFIKQRL